TDKHEAGAVAHRIIDALNEPFVIFGSEVYLTVSIGIAVATGESATAETLLHQADAAMYSGKTEVGAPVQVWADEGPRRRGLDDLFGAEARAAADAEAALHRPVVLAVLLRRPAEHHSDDGDVDGERQADDDREQRGIHPLKVARPRT